MNPQEAGIQIKVTDEMLQGRYANVAQVTHTPEEIVIDFFLAAPPVGQLVSRVVMSAGHAKRLMKVLQGSIDQIEKETGEEISEPDVPRKIGYKTD